MIITISPPKEVAKKLAVEGGLGAESFHITLFFISDEDSKNFKTIIDSIQAMIKVSELASPFVCKIKEFSKFENVKAFDSKGNSTGEKNMDVIFAKVEGAELYSYRASLAKKLDELGVPYSKLHPTFQAHISIKYVPSGETIDTKDVLPLEFKVSEVELWADKEEKFIYAFGGLEKRA